MQIGIRGNSNSDYNSRRTNFLQGLDYPWDMSKFGSSNTSHSCVLTSSHAPQNGLTFVYEEPYSNDIGIIEVANPERVIEETTQNIEINLKNFGTTTLTSATIKWKLNDGAVSTYSWSGSLATGAVENINVIGGFDFSTENHYTIEAWTENPNGTPDANPNNDYLKSYHAVNLYCNYFLTGDEWYYLTNVVISNIVHYGCGIPDDGTQDYSSHFYGNHLPGETINYTITRDGYDGYFAFWIDYNDDNTFAEDECLGIFSDMEPTGSFTLPEDAPLGMHKLRLRYFANTMPATTDACTSLEYLNWKGDCHDYAINIYNPSTPPECASNPTPTNCFY